jgi:hypothetical protein|tara:strand:+ start:5002 stop:5241 length:240 start_codon:yes stop_codon:yes gene_type:complete
MCGIAKGGLSSMAYPEVCVNQNSFWNYGAPPGEKQGSKMLLLTIGKICIIGKWRNCEAGVIGWKELPNRDKELELSLGL